MPIVFVELSEWRWWILTIQREGSWKAYLARYLLAARAYSGAINIKTEYHLSIKVNDMLIYVQPKETLRTLFQVFS